MSGPTTINLTIYIDNSLILPDPTTGLPKLGNLMLARKVAGVANVVFQSKDTSDFSDANYFSWQQSYKIGATRVPAQVKATTQKQTIAANYMCDWTGTGGHPLQTMPTAVPVDAGWLARYPASTNMFGTKNQPTAWFNVIYCATGGSDYSAIYTDPVPAPPGMSYRGYSVSNDYQLSWESTSFAPGIFAANWSTPWPFSLAGTQTQKYVSWGPTLDGKEVKWFDYGTVDPGKHDPSQAAPPLSNMSLISMSMGLSAGSFERQPVNIRLDWADSSLSEKAKKERALMLFTYLSKSTSGYLCISNVFIDTYITAAMNLLESTSFGDLLPGETESDKITYYLRGLVSNVSPRFAPTISNWKYNLAVEAPAEAAAPAGLASFFGLKFTGLTVASAITSAGAASVYIADQLRQQLKDVEFSAETITTDTANNTVAYSKFTFKNISPADYATAMKALNGITGAESKRTTPLPNNPDVATPDYVTVIPDNSMLSLIPADEDPTDGLPVNGSNGA